MTKIINQVKKAIMENNSLNIDSAGNITINTDIIFDNAKTIMEKGSFILQNYGKDCVLDWSQVARVDSSALSVVIRWLRLANNLKITITHKNVPDSLTGLAKIVGLTQLFV